MKRFLILLGLAAIVMVSCSEKNEGGNVAVGSRLVLTGEACTATKVSIGEKDGDTYPLLWFTGDVVSINSKDASVTGAFVGELADLESSSSGNVQGTFLTENELSVKSDMELLLLYPGDRMSYEDGVITGSVAAVQTQPAANVSTHIGGGCFSYAEASVTKGQTDAIKFALSQKTAFVKVFVTGGEKYSSYSLTGVEMLAEGEELAGSVSFDVSTELMSVSDASESVGVTLSAAAPLSEDVEVYFTAIPDDLTGKTVSMTFSVVDSSETPETVTIDINGGLLKAGALSIIAMDVSGDFGGWLTELEGNAGNLDEEDWPIPGDESNIVNEGNGTAGDLEEIIW